VNGESRRINVPKPLNDIAFFAAAFAHCLDRDDARCDVGGTGVDDQGNVRSFCDSFGLVLQ
jgi:hypothetical protein